MLAQYENEHHMLRTSAFLLALFYLSLSPFLTHTHTYIHTRVNIHTHVQASALTCLNYLKPAQIRGAYMYAKKKIAGIAMVDKERVTGKVSCLTCVATSSISALLVEVCGLKLILKAR